MPRVKSLLIVPAVYTGPLSRFIQMIRNPLCECLFQYTDRFVSNADSVSGWGCLAVNEIVSAVPGFI